MWEVAVNSEDEEQIGSSHSGVPNSIVTKFYYYKTVRCLRLERT